jgi:hypothetical protein
MGWRSFPAGGFKNLIIVALRSQMQDAVEKTGLLSILAGSVAL